MPEYLQQIHLEGKFPHVIMCNEALSFKCESRTWGAGVGNSDPGSRHRCAQPWGAVSAGVAGMLMFFKEKGRKTRILETKFCFEGGKEQNKVLASAGKSMADMQVRFSSMRMRCKWDSWMPWSFLEIPAQERARWAQSLVSVHSCISYILPSPDG